VNAIVIAIEAATETGDFCVFCDRCSVPLDNVLTTSCRGRDDRDRSRERDRERRSEREREDDDPIKRVEREAEKQRRDLDRDLRTVFVSQVTIRATREDLEDFFSQAGKVAEVHLIRDTRTKKSKGLAYIEMDSVDSVPKALALCGQLVLGLPCIVQASQAERNRDALVRLNQQNNPVEVPRLAIENLDAKTTEIDLMRVFETYGIIEQVELSRDAQGRSRGSASIVFRRMEDARKAQATLDRQDMNGRPMHISMNTKVVSGPAAGGGSGGVRSQVEALDDNDENGVTLTAQSRAQLMLKLQRGDSAGIPPPVAAISVQPLAPLAPHGPKNPNDLVLQLSHMFDIKDPDVGEPNFFEELQARENAAPLFFSHGLQLPGMRRAG
jgi:RNA-binding protein 23/39